MRGNLDHLDNLDNLTQNPQQNRLFLDSFKIAPLIILIILPSTAAANREPRATIAPRANLQPGALKNARQSWQPWQPYPNSPAKSLIPNWFQDCSLSNLGNLARNRGHGPSGSPPAQRCRLTPVRRLPSRAAPLVFVPAASCLDDPGENPYTWRQVAARCYRTDGARGPENTA